MDSFLTKYTNVSNLQVWKLSNNSCSRFLYDYDGRLVNHRKRIDTENGELNLWKSGTGTEWTMHNLLFGWVNRMIVFRLNLRAS